MKPGSWCARWGCPGRAASGWPQRPGIEDNRLQADETSTNSLQVSYGSHERIRTVMELELKTMLALGDELDHYRLEAVVARGGMSTLYRATDLRDGSQVALKAPHPEMEADPVLVERFRREQQIGHELDHPGIVKTMGGEDRSRMYMVIEWVEGRLLRAVLNETGRLPVERPRRLRWASAKRWTICTNAAWCTGI